MTAQHKDLAAGRWSQMPFVEQMANIGSEVERALSWRAKNHHDYCRRATDRALELIDLSLAGTQSPSRLKELARSREALVDFFEGTNEYHSSEESWRKYFMAFAYAARIDR